MAHDQTIHRYTEHQVWNIEQHHQSEQRFWHMEYSD